jgi:hypothetical protein
MSTNMFGMLERTYLTSQTSSNMLVLYLDCCKQYLQMQLDRETGQSFDVCEPQELHNVLQE